MKKNKFFILITFMLATLLLAACSGDSNDGSYEISYSTWANKGEAAYDGMEKFKEIVEEESDGDITVDLYPGNELGTTEEQLEQLKLGQIQMMSSGDPGLQEILYLALPYLMNSIDNWKYVLDSDIGEEFNDKLINEEGIRTIEMLVRGPRVLSANKEIHKPEDMEGLKIRSPEQDYYVQTLEAFGANPTPMDIGEVYNGLDSGVVDGQENPLSTFVSYGFEAVQDYVIRTNHIDKPAFVNINEEFLKDLPEDFQEIVLAAAKEGSAYAKDQLTEAEQEMVEDMEAEGVTFIEPDIKPFEKATQKVRDELGTDMWGEEIYEEIVEMGQKDLD